MQYRKITIPELGEIEFFGNIGAFAEFESESGLSIQDIAAQKTISVNNMFILLYWAHYVACKRLKKDLKASKEDFKLFLTGEKLVSLTTELIQDVVEDMGFSNSETQEQKKTR